MMTIIKPKVQFVRYADARDIAQAHEKLAVAYLLLREVAIATDRNHRPQLMARGQRALLRVADNLSGVLFGLESQFGARTTGCWPLADRENPRAWIEYLDKLESPVF